VCDDPFGAFRYKLDITPQSAGLPYIVKATVTWNSSGRARSASVSTLIAPHLGDDPTRPHPRHAVERLNEASLHAS